MRERGKHIGFRRRLQHVSRRELVSLWIARGSNLKAFARTRRASPHIPSRHLAREVALVLSGVGMVLDKLEAMVAQEISVAVDAEREIAERDTVHLAVDAAVPIAGGEQEGRAGLERPGHIRQRPVLTGVIERNMTPQATAASNMKARRSQDSMAAQNVDQERQGERGYLGGLLVMSDALAQLYVSKVEAICPEACPGLAQYRCAGACLTLWELIPRLQDPSRSHACWIDPRRTRRRQVAGDRADCREHCYRSEDHRLKGGGSSNGL